MLNTVHCLCRHCLVLYNYGGLKTTKGIVGYRGFVQINIIDTRTM